MNRSESLRTLTFAALCALSLVHPEANAECFSMYTANNVLAYESGTSPIDLSRSISAEMARRFPARYLVISTTASCGDNTIDISSGRSDGGADSSGGSAATTGPGDKSNPYDAPKARVRAARRR